MYTFCTFNSAFYVYYRNFRLKRTAHSALDECFRTMCSAIINKIVNEKINE